MIPGPVVTVDLSFGLWLNEGDIYMMAVTYIMQVLHQVMRKRLTILKDAVVTSL
jgi:hypothetical protein